LNVRLYKFVFERMEYLGLASGRVAKR